MIASQASSPSSLLSQTKELSVEPKWSIRLVNVSQSDKMTSMSSASRLRRLIETHLILFNVFAKSRTHVLGRIGYNLNLSPEFLFEFKGEFV